MTDSRERVETIKQLMLTGEWVRGKTGKQLSQEWGLSYSRVRELSSQASRVLDALENRDHLERVARHRLMEIQAENGPDRVPALRTVLQNIGRLTERHELATGVEAMTREQALAAAIEILDNPDEVTAEALETLGYRRVVETEGTETE